MNGIDAKAQSGKRPHPDYKNYPIWADKRIGYRRRLHHLVIPYLVLTVAVWAFRAGSRARL
jgi:hypothetical protein